MPGDAGDGLGLVFHGVMEQTGSQHVRVGDPVVAQHPQGHPQHVVHVGLPRATLLGVQHTSRAGRIRDRGASRQRQLIEFHGETAPETRRTADLRDGVQRHHSKLRRCYQNLVPVVCGHTSMIAAADLHRNYELASRL
ncbi:hypothetical protein [Paractinoplanes abujensis]|uniref:Uncharacterized protein n=1 Tax=Paractinoplanes abujensis TaxID=882441 RepID=A0A7W7CSL5_9ACTN|nr:hypothetical protein [Actinoplanes abujensis]MBB4693574.1 hypothetical protein [Actinoplanes abujensis]